MYPGACYPSRQHRDMLTLEISHESHYGMGSWSFFYSNKENSLRVTYSPCDTMKNPCWVIFTSMN